MKAPNKLDQLSSHQHSSNVVNGQKNVIAKLIWNIASNNIKLLQTGTVLLLNDKQWNNTKSAV